MAKSRGSCADAIVDDGSNAVAAAAALCNIVYYDVDVHHIALQYSIHDRLICSYLGKRANNYFCTDVDVYNNNKEHIAQLCGTIRNYFLFRRYF